MQEIRWITLAALWLLSYISPSLYFYTYQKPQDDT